MHGDDGMMGHGAHVSRGAPTTQLKKLTRFTYSFFFASVCRYRQPGESEEMP
jgi:hypothetical protein